ncbi:MAG: hypothetical protein IJT94_12060 [Oscillibacter sp.]|nr:hypothetical protein [Oscillibacter sp.]
MAKKQTASSNELWDRMPGESVRNYEYFCAYRDMRYTPASGADDVPKLDLTRDRSLRRLGEQLGRNYKTLGSISSKFNWQARCDAYDLYILRRQRDKNEAKILKMRENHAAIGEQMLKRAMRRLLSITDGEIEAGDMVRMVDIGVKVERLSRGESTEKQEVSGKTAVTHSGSVTVAQDIPDLSALSEEEMDAYERILDKLYPKPDG